MYSQLENASSHNYDDDVDDDGINRSDNIYNTCMQSSKAVTMILIVFMAMVE